MTHWNIAICDDEKAALSVLGGSLVNAFRQHGVEATVEMFVSAQSLLRRMRECTFDLLFLDIEMPGMDGLTLTRQLRKEGNLIDIIFISNREDLVFDALRYNAKGFIRKSRFIQDVPSVIDAYFAARQDTKSQVLIVQSREQVLYVPIDKLTYIEGSGKVQLAHVVDRKEPIELRKQMQQLEDELKPYGFLRIHKGFLVNYRFIRRINAKEVVLTSEELLPISRRKEQETRDAYLELMQGEGSLVL
ncbi:MAG: LytR/AlgR family response regulator transcription factor [Aristaeellaceae bacterium]